MYLFQGAPNTIVLRGSLQTKSSVALKCYADEGYPAPRVAIYANDQELGFGVQEIEVTYQTDESQRNALFVCKASTQGIPNVQISNSLDLSTFRKLWFSVNSMLTYLSGKCF